MKYPALALGGILLLCGIVFATSRTGSNSVGKVVDRPDIRLAVPMNREPTAEEIARLEGVVGCSPAGAIGRLGHPDHIGDSNRPDDDEVWWYPWGDPRGPSPGKLARVWFRSGKAVMARYEEGQTGFSVPTNYFADEQATPPEEDAK